MNDIICYAEAVESGAIVVGKWIRLWYRYITDGLKAQRFFYSEKKAKLAVLFIESFLHHNKGALAPGPVKLELWQRAALSVIFGILDGDGNRQFREVLMVIARKNGKTLLAAGIALLMTFLDDYGAEVYFTAPKLDQANICFDAFFQSIRREPELHALVKKRRMDVYVDENNAAAKALAFSSRKSDGLNVSCAICDEIASWRGDAGLRFYEVLKSSGGARRQPLYFNISTAGYESDGIFDELVKRGTRVLMGGSRETRLAPFLYMVDHPEKWDDMSELKKSNPNLGVSVTSSYLLDEIAVADGSLSKRAEFLTKYCNVKQNSSLAWLDAVVVRKMCGPPVNLEDFRDCYCVAGVDLSQTTDLTAACLLLERGGELYVIAKFWMPAGKLAEASARDGLPYHIYVQRGLMELSGENFVDYRDCFRWFMELIQKWRVYPLKVGYDRYSAQYLVQDMKAASFHMDDVYQGDNLWGVLQEMEGLFKDGKVHIGDNDLLKVHLLNSAIRMNTERGRGRLVKIEPTAHIDGVAALADAFTMRQKWHEEIGTQLKNNRDTDNISK